MPKKEILELNLSLTLEKNGEDLTLLAVTVEGEEIPIEVEESIEEYFEDETILGVDQTTALAVGMGLLGIGQGK